MDWRQEILRQIDSGTEHYQIENQDPTHYFIGDWQLLDVWRHVYGLSSYYRVDAEVVRLRQYILDELDPDKSVVKIASILVRINWSAWNRFAKIFINSETSRRDGNLPFKLKDLSRPDFLGQNHAQLFFELQSTFLPITIEEGNDREYSTQFRLPFNWEGERPSSGSYGEVTKVKIARGYFKYHPSGEYNLRQERILARKRLKRPEDYEREVRNLKIIRHNAQKHDNIMGHIGTIVVGREFNIFFEWADRDLNDLLYNGDLPESERPPHRLLAEAGELAGAVNFLHEHIKVDSNHLKCYHMDLKPENVVIRQRSKNDPIGRWMITDFGISIFHDNFTGSRTTAQRYGGAFQPPEIDESWGKRTEGINEKGDIWGLGGILCMVLAFAVGGTESVQVLQHARAYNAVGKQKQDFFYVLVHNGQRRVPILKQSVSRWLGDVAEFDPGAIWISECVRLIKWILQIDQKERPTASQINDRLGVISRLSKPGGQLSRQNTDIPDFPPDSGNSIVQDAAERLQNSIATPSGPTYRELATGTDSLSSPFSRHSYFRRDSAQHSDRDNNDITRLRNSTSTQDSEYLSRQLANSLSVSPSSGSTGGLRLREGSRHTLEGSRAKNGKLLLKDVALCPTGNRIIGCTKTGSIVYDRQQNDRRTTYTLVKSSTSACDRVYIAGLFYALYGVAGVNIVLDSVNTEADNSFGTTDSTNSESNLVLGLDISTRGVVALRLPGFLRLRVAKSAMRPDELIQQSYTYQLSGRHGNENFEAVAFSADGERLMACSWKSWFLWDLRIVSQRYLDVPKMGDLNLGRGYGGYKPTIIPMTIRAAFLVYDSTSETVWLYDSILKSVAKDHCAMKCGIVTPQDRHLLYIRSERVKNSRKHQYVLMHKSIDLVGTGHAQHLVLGEEKKVFVIEGLHYDADVIRLAFLQPGSSCDLIIASSAGEVVEVRLEDL